MAHQPLDRAFIIEATKKWIETVVIGLNLCPFASVPFQQKSIRFALTESTSKQKLLNTLHSELSFLQQNSDIETCLLIHPQALINFSDYNQFLQAAEDLLEDLDFAGEFQIASFHPDYQFAGTMLNDAENYTNRSPFPMLHILREASLNKALQNYPNPEAIPQRKIERLQKMGVEEAQTMLRSCLNYRSE